MPWRCVLQTLFNWLVLAIVIFFMVPSSQAVTLGSPIILSKPKEALRAEITVRTGAEDKPYMESLAIDPVAKTEYERLGISPRILDYKPSITLKRKQPDQFLIMVETEDPIDADNDPFIDIILGLKWSNGGVAKTYSLMVGDVNKVTVRPGQSLSEIASQIRPQLGNADLDETLLALYKANPDAFIGGSIHRLRAGAQLNKPDASVLSSITPAQAKEFVQEANQAWREQRGESPQSTSPNKAVSQTPSAASGVGEDRLRIGPGSGDEAETRRYIEEIVTQEKALAQTKARVAELEKNIADLQKVLEARKAALNAGEQPLPKSDMDQWGPAVVGLGLTAITGLLLWWLARYSRRAESQPSETTVADAGSMASANPAAIPPNAAAILSSLDLNLSPTPAQHDADALRVKLNLAKAYITIEDFEAARKALEEILLVSSQVDPQITIAARGLIAEINQRNDH
ncbi:MAG: pilus assembly protein FimV [Betaproteobacteria bacterium]|nr:pilus assembly protein FimV [Betaproteobacteria bacterium]